MSIPKTCAGPFVVRLGFPSVGPSSPADTWTVLFDSVRVTVGP
jgi:hypothetical protein